MEARASEVSSRLQVYTSGFSPAELLYGNKIRTKLQEIEGDEEEERSGTTDQQGRDQDVERKK